MGSSWTSPSVMISGRALSYASLEGQNPRTAKRALVTGEFKMLWAWGIIGVSLIFFHWSFCQNTTATTNSNALKAHSHRCRTALFSRSTIGEEGWGEGALSMG